MAADRSILTPKQREYLHGDLEKSGADDRTFRKRMRERIRAGLTDFKYLADPSRLEDRDLQLIRELKDDSGVVTQPLHRADGRVTQEPVMDPDIEDARVEVVAFVFRVKPGRQYVERVVKAAVDREIERSEQYQPDTEVGDVRVPIEDPDLVAERIEWCFEEGHPLTDAQVRIALEHELRPADEIGAHVREQGTRQEGISQDALQNLRDSMEEWVEERTPEE
jgi:hypothetical protein